MSGSKAQSELKLPDGFSIEIDGHGVGFDLVRSKLGYTTIDWRERCFRAGITSVGQRLNSREYKGTGWRQLLVDDAVMWLRKLERRA